MASRTRGPLSSGASWPYLYIPEATNMAASSDTLSTSSEYSARIGTRRLDSSMRCGMSFGSRARIAPNSSLLGPHLLQNTVRKLISSFEMLHANRAWRLSSTSAIQKRHSSHSRGVVQQTLLRPGQVQLEAVTTSDESGWLAYGQISRPSLLASLRSRRVQWETFAQCAGNKVIRRTRQDTLKIANS